MTRKFEGTKDSHSFKKFKKTNHKKITGNDNKKGENKKVVDKKFNNLLSALQKDVENQSSNGTKRLKRKSDEKTEPSFKKMKLENNSENPETSIDESVPLINKTAIKKPSKKNKFRKLSSNKNEVASINIPSSSNNKTPEDKTKKLNNTKPKSVSNGNLQKQQVVPKLIPKNKGSGEKSAKTFTKNKIDGKSKINNTVQTIPKIEAKNTNDEIWFDDVDEILIHSSKIQSKDVATLVKPNSNTETTKAVAMDCEMVGIGWRSEESMLARVSIVNQFGHPLYDKFVKPREKITDYRTKVSGIRPSDLVNGEDFKVVQKEVYNITKGRILVGHAIRHDLKVLFLDHPHKMIRDTSQFKPFRALKGGGTPSLKKLSEDVLGVKIQEGEHNSVQDAQAAMRLYTMYKKRWETSIKERRFKKKTPAKKDSKKEDNGSDDDDDAAMEFYD